MTTKEILEEIEKRRDSQDESTDNFASFTYMSGYDWARFLKEKADTSLDLSATDDDVEFRESVLDLATSAVALVEAIDNEM